MKKNPLANEEDNEKDKIEKDEMPIEENESSKTSTSEDKNERNGEQSNDTDKNIDKVKQIRDQQNKAKSTDYYTKPFMPNKHSSMPIPTTSIEAKLFDVPTSFTKSTYDGRVLVTNRIRRMFEVKYNMSKRISELGDNVIQNAYQEHVNTPEDFKKYKQFFTEGIESAWATLNVKPYTRDVNKIYTHGEIHVDPTSVDLKFGESSLNIGDAHEDCQHMALDDFTKNSTLSIVELVLTNILEASYTAGNFVYINNSGDIHNHRVISDFEEHIKKCGSNSTAIILKSDTLVDDTIDGTMIGQFPNLGDTTFPERVGVKPLNGAENDPLHMIPFIVRYYRDANSPIHAHLLGKGYDVVPKMGEISSPNSGTAPMFKNYIVTAFSDPLTSLLNHNYLNYIHTTLVRQNDMLALFRTTLITEEMFNLNMNIARYRFYQYNLEYSPGAHVTNFYTFPNLQDNLELCRLCSLIDSNYVPRMISTFSRKIAAVFEQFPPLSYDDAQNVLQNTNLVSLPQYTSLANGFATKYNKIISPTTLASYISYNTFAEFLVVSYTPIMETIDTTVHANIYFVMDVLNLLVLEYTFERFLEFNKHVWANYLVCFFMKYFQEEFTSMLNAFGLAIDKTTRKVLFTLTSMPNTHTFVYSENIQWFFELPLNGYPALANMMRLFNFSRRLSQYKEIPPSSIRPRGLKYWIPGEIYGIYPTTTPFTILVRDSIDLAKTTFSTYKRNYSISKAPTLAAYEAYMTGIMMRVQAYGNWFHQVYAPAVAKVNLENLEMFWNQQVPADMRNLRYAASFVTDVNLPAGYAVSTPPIFLSIENPVGISMAITYNSCYTMHAHGTATVNHQLPLSAVNALTYPGVTADDVNRLKSTINQYKKFIEILMIVHGSLTVNDNIIGNQTIARILQSTRVSAAMSSGYFKSMLRQLGYSINETITSIAETFFINANYVNYMPINLQYSRISANSHQLSDPVRINAAIRPYVLQNFNLLIDTLFDPAFGLRKLSRGYYYFPYAIQSLIHDYQMFPMPLLATKYTFKSLTLILQPMSYQDDNVLTGDEFVFEYYLTATPNVVHEVRSSTDFQTLRAAIVQSTTNFYRDPTPKFMLSLTVYQTVTQQCVAMINAMYKRLMITVYCDFWTMPIFQPSKPEQHGHMPIDGVFDVALPNVPAQSNIRMVVQKIYTSLGTTRHQTRSSYFFNDIVPNGQPNIQDCRLMNRIYVTNNNQVPVGIYMEPDLFMANDVPISMYARHKVGPNDHYNVARKSLITNNYVSGTPMIDVHCLSLSLKSIADVA